MLRLFSCLCLSLYVLAISAEDFLATDFNDAITMELKYFSFAPHDEFSLGNFSNDWDNSERYEIVLSFNDYWQSRRGFYGGLYVFWEERDWDQGSRFVDTKVFGAGYEFGGRFWLIAPRDEPPLNIAICPYGRFGFAFQDVDFENIPDGADIIDGGVDVERIEWMFGLDIHARLASRLEITAGVGAHVWLSDQVASDVNGSAVSTESFNGDSLFYRISFGMRF